MAEIKGTVIEMLTENSDRLNRLEDAINRLLEQLSTLKAEKESEEKEVTITVEEEKKLRPYEFDPTLDGKFPGKKFTHQEHVLQTILSLQTFKTWDVVEKLGQIYKVALSDYGVYLSQVVYAGLAKARRNGLIVERIPGHFEVKK